MGMVAHLAAVASHDQILCESVSKYPLARTVKRVYRWLISQVLFMIALMCCCILCIGFVGRSISHPNMPRGYVCGSDSKVK